MERSETAISKSTYMVVGLKGMKRSREDYKRRKAPLIVLSDSDEEDQGLEQPSRVLEDNGTNQKKAEEELAAYKHNKRKCFGAAEESPKNKQDYELSDAWSDMFLAFEISKNVPADEASDEDEENVIPTCDHSFILKDDIGSVCRVCGLIDKRIEHMIDVQYKKPSTNRRYYSRRDSNDGEEADESYKPMKFSTQNASHGVEICAHPTHMELMKPHQKEGFKFLESNLMNEKPGGCVLAHAPGSGKTFMVISFVQSFLAKYPEGRPLVVLPKGIISSWKKEFQRWQIEDIPLLNMYSAKADNRKQQLGVLLEWKENKSILFLGYQQFSNIVSDSSNNTATKRCQEILLQLPSILILDEGHTPRNKETDIVSSLAKVATPRKVVLSGTLYQNHVPEVFTILELVQPRFMKLKESIAIKKRIMSYVNFSGLSRKHLNGQGDGPFYELVENTLKQEQDSGQKEKVIMDLRELTSRILHYYKGDFLDELPGLVDFTVLLKLTRTQKTELDILIKTNKSRLKINSHGSILYVHPKLKAHSDIYGTGVEAGDEEFIDQLLEEVDIEEGVKAKFFIKLLSLCEAAHEKLLVFGQYLLPLRFLERLAILRKGWKIGKEIFVISGNTSAEQREWSMERFNSCADAKVLFGSIKACGEGISLVGASRVVILDVHLNPSVSRQAIGRAFRPGQQKKVYVYRLVSADSPEEEDHATCYKKELISKRWFEWNDHDKGTQQFQLEEVHLKDSGDMFLESPSLVADVKLLQKR